MHYRAFYRLDNRQDIGETLAMPTSGPELRRERRLAEITTVALASEIGVSRATLYTVERSAVVDPDRAVSYRAALKALTVAKKSAA